MVFFNSRTLLLRWLHPFTICPHTPLTVCSFFRTTQEPIQRQSVKPGSFSARTDGASRPFGDAMMMMIAQTAAMRRTAVSSPESVSLADKHNDASLAPPCTLNVPAIMYHTSRSLDALF